MVEGAGMDMTCCADAQREIAYLLEQCDRSAMQVEDLRAQLHRQTLAELERPQPLGHDRIALIAAGCTHAGRLDPQAFALALEKAHGIKDPAFVPWVGAAL